MILKSCDLDPWIADCNVGIERTTLRTLSIWATREDAGLDDVLGSRIGDAAI